MLLFVHPLRIVNTIYVKDVTVSNPKVAVTSDFAAIGQHNTKLSL